MLKRNLIVIAIIAFGLVMAGNTFGQTDPATGQATGKRKTNKPNTGFMDYTDDACSVCDGKIKATKTKTARDAASGQATGRRMKTANRKNITADDDWEAPTKANRRQFDHIGNINGSSENTTRNRKPKAERFAGTIMEGSNIHRKRPRKGKGKDKH